MSISVIIIARNEEEKIGRMLDSLYKQTLLPDEVIVVDNASTDSTASIAREHGAIIVYEPITIRGKARTTGFSVSKEDFVAVSDADFVLDVDWLKHLYQRIIVNDNIGGVSATILALNRNRLVPRLIELSSKVPRVGNAVMMYRRQALMEVDSWNPQLHNAEDVELAMRILNKGYSIVYEKEAKVFHEWPEKLSTFLKRQSEYGYWNMIAKKKNRSITKKNWLLMFAFPLVFIKHIPKIRMHLLLPIFLTLSTYAYTIGMWRGYFQ